MGYMKKHPLYKSFGYAFEGIFDTIKAERNMQIHCFMTLCVVIAGFVCRITWSEWLVCLILFALVTSFELMNTALEAVVDLVTEEKKPLAKKAKDAAAGAVLASALFAALIGLMIFIPKIPNLLHALGIM